MKMRELKQLVAENPKWFVAIVIVFLSSMLYALAMQLCVSAFGLTKFEALPYATLCSTITAMAIELKLGWFSWKMIKDDPWFFAIAGFCTMLIVVLGLASYAEPSLNAATATVLLKGQLIPLCLLIDLVKKERLNSKDFAALALAIGAIGFTMFGVLRHATPAEMAVYRSFTFWSVFLAYGIVYTIRTPIIRKYQKCEGYPGSEQLFTLSCLLLASFVAAPLIAHLVPGTGVGNVAKDYMSSLLHPTWKKIVAGLIIGFFFGCYAPAVVWVMGNTRNASQAAIIHKALAGFGNVIAAIVVVTVMVVGVWHGGSILEFLGAVVFHKKAPSAYEWVGTLGFLAATVVAALGAAQRAAEKATTLTAPASSKGLVVATTTS